VRLPPGSIFIPTRGATVKGLGVFKMRSGTLVLQKHPRKQPVARTDAEAANRNYLASLAEVMKYVNAYEQEFARSLAKQTQLAPRDLLFIAYSGRLGYLIRKDGTKIYAMTSKYQVSSILDSIGQFPGMMLYRGDQTWENVPIGAAGQVLTVSDDLLPTWAAGGGAGGGHWYQEPASLAPQVGGQGVGNNAFSTMPFYCMKDATFTGVRVFLQAVQSGLSIYPVIYDASATSGSLSGAALLGSHTATTPAVGLNTLPFTSPVNVLAGNFYYFGYGLLGTNFVFPASIVFNRPHHWVAQSSYPPPSTVSGTVHIEGPNSMSHWLY